MPRSGSSVIDIYSMPIADNRGSFSRLFCVNDYGEVAKFFSVRQVNFSQLQRPERSGVCTFRINQNQKIKSSFV